MDGPYIGLDPYASGDEKIFFRLLALRVNPHLLDAKESGGMGLKDNAHQFANDLLLRPNSYLEQSGGWSGQNEV